MLEDYSNQKRELKLKKKKTAQSGGSFSAQMKRQEINKGFLRVKSDRIKIKIK